MRIIQSNSYKKLEADLIEHPPITNEEEDTLLKNKKKKKIYQLGIWLDDVDIEDVVE